MRILLAVCALVVGFTAHAFAEGGKLTLTEPYAFGVMSVPTDGGEFRLMSLRFGGNYERNADFMSRAVLEVEMMPSPYLRLGYLSVPSRDLDGTVLTVNVGQFLSPVWSAYPSARDLQLTAFPDAATSFTVYQRGVRLDLVSAVSDADSVKANVSCANDGRVTVRLNYKTGVCDGSTISLNGYVEGKKGFGANIAQSGGTWWWNPGFGATRFVDGDDVGYVQNAFTVMPGTKVWVEGNFVRGGDAHALTGVTVQYAPQSFLKLYSDSGTDDIAAMFTFTF